MAQVMKMKITNFQLDTAAPKRCSDRSAIARKNALVPTTAQSALLLDNLPSIVAGGGEKWDALIVAFLFSRIFAISNEKHFGPSLDIGPSNGANLLLAHRSCDSETDDLPNRSKLPRLGFEMVDKLI